MLNINSFSYHQIRIMDRIIKLFAWVIIAGILLIAGLTLVFIDHRKPVAPRAVSDNIYPIKQTKQLSPVSVGLEGQNRVSPVSSDSSDKSASVSTNVISTNSNGSAKTSVSVNGQQVNVPANGTNNIKVGNAQVQISNQQQSNVSGNNSSSSINLSVSSSSSSSINGAAAM